MIKNKKIMMLATTDNMLWQFLLPHIKYLQAQGAARYQIDLDNYKEGGILSMQTGGPFDVMQYLNDYYYNLSSYH